MFRHPLLIALSLLFLQSQAQADGLPYTTGEAGERAMNRDFLAIKISGAQIEEISKSGVISLDKQQLKNLRVYYPEFPATAGVASSTFNDNLERFEADVDVIWWYADEIRVPLLDFSGAEAAGMPSREPWCMIEDALVRIAPDGTPYRKGQKTTYRAILAAIDEAATKPVRYPNERPSLRVIVPPPHRHGWIELNRGVAKDILPENASTEANKAIPRIFEFLEAYAHARGLSLFKTW